VVCVSLLRALKTEFQLSRQEFPFLEQEVTASRFTLKHTTAWARSKGLLKMQCCPCSCHHHICNRDFKMRVSCLRWPVRKLRIGGHQHADVVPAKLTPREGHPCGGGDFMENPGGYAQSRQWPLGMQTQARRTMNPTFSWTHGRC